MFNKGKTGILVIILIILIAVYLMVRFWGSDDRTFKDIVVLFDPKDVTEVIIHDPQADKDINLVLTGSEWRLDKGEKTYPADSNVVENILAQLGSLSTKRYAGKGEEAWIKYEVLDTTAINIILKKDNKTLHEILIGKFSFSMPKDQNQQMGRQQRGDMTTYVRLASDQEVYAVDGFLRMNFNRDADSYRDKTISNINNRDITKVVLEQPENKLTIINSEGTWLVNGQLADSVKTVNYFSAISGLNSPNFVDETMVGSKPFYKVQISGNNFMPVEIAAYPVADTNINFAVHSSLNKESYFNGKKNGLLDKIFISEADLLPDNE